MVLRVRRELVAGRRERAVTIERRDDRVVLRCHLIERPTMLTTPLKYTFGFHATPVKKPEKTVWDYRITHHGNYGLEREPARPAAERSRIPRRGTCGPRRERLSAGIGRPSTRSGNCRSSKRKRMVQPALLAIRWGRDIMQGTNCGFYLNEQVQGPVVWSRKDGTRAAEPRAPFDWKAGQWHHVALTWSDSVRHLRRRPDALGDATAAFIPAPLEGSDRNRRRTGGRDDRRSAHLERRAAAGGQSWARYQPDAQTLLLDHFDDDGDRRGRMARRPGTAGTTDPQRRLRWQGRPQRDLGAGQVRPRAELGTGSCRRRSSSGWRRRACGRSASTNTGRRTSRIRT